MNTYLEREGENNNGDDDNGNDNDDNDENYQIGLNLDIGENLNANIDETEVEFIGAYNGGRGQDDEIQRVVRNGLFEMEQQFQIQEDVEIGGSDDEDGLINNNN